MRKHEAYKKIISSRRWGKLRNRKLSETAEKQGQSYCRCEECVKKWNSGDHSQRPRFATEVHHIKPIGIGKTMEEMEALAFDMNNLEAVCRDCHEKLHDDMGSKKNLKKRMSDETNRLADNYFNKMFIGG